MTTRPAYVWDDVADEWVKLGQSIADLAEYPNMTTTPISGFRNAIINGDFRVNQRNLTSSGITGNTTYGFDRWMNIVSGGTVTMSAQTFTVGSPAASGYESQNFLRQVVASQSASSNYAGAIQYIEDVRTYAGSTITVSFWAKAGSGTPKIAVELQQNFGSGGSPSSTVFTAAGQVTLSTSWNRYSITVTVPSISGKTIGTTANTSSLGILLWTSAGSDLNARTGSLGIQNNTFDIWGVQVERGTIATPFEQRPIGTELALCQRYFMAMSNNSSSIIFTRGVDARPVSFFFTPVSMRPINSVTTIGTFNVANLWQVIGGAISSPILNNQSENHITVAWTSWSGLSADRVYVLSGSGATIYLGAEL